MPSYPQYTPYTGDPYSYGVTGGEHNYFPTMAPSAPATPPGPGPSSAPSREGASESGTNNADTQNPDEVIRGYGYDNPQDPTANMTYDEYMQWVNSPPEGGRSLPDWMRLSALGINPGRLGSAAAGLAGSALAGTGGGLAASGIYDAAALRNRAWDISNTRGFTPQLNFWDYIMAALPFVSPESRIAGSNWRPDNLPSQDFSDDSGVSEEAADLHSNAPAWGSNPNEAVTSEPLAPPQDVPPVPTANIYDEPAAWQEMVDQLRQYSQENYGNSTISQEHIPPIQQGPLQTSPIEDFTAPTPYFDPQNTQAPLAQPASPISPVAYDSGQNIYDMIDNMRNMGVVPNADSTNYELAPPQEEEPQIPMGTPESVATGLTSPISHSPELLENGVMQYQPHGGLMRNEYPIAPSQSTGPGYEELIRLQEAMDQELLADTTPQGNEETRPSEYEEQWSTPEEVFENYDPGETYDEYAEGGRVSAFAAGGIAKRRTRKYDERLLDFLAETLSKMSPEARKEAETELLKYMPKGIYSSKMAEMWPEEYAPFGGNDLYGDPIPIPVPDHFKYDEYAIGGKVSGPGGGMDDMVPATIEGHQMAKLSNDEFVIPADVVSQLGDGSSNAGHRKLYDFISNIREAKTGNPAQPPKLMSALKGLNEHSRGKPQNTFISDVIKMKQAFNPNDDRSYASEYVRAIKSVMESR